MQLLHDFSKFHVHSGCEKSRLCATSFLLLLSAIIALPTLALWYLFLHPFFFKFRKLWTFRVLNFQNLPFSVCVQKVWNVFFCFFILVANSFFAVPLFLKTSFCHMMSMMDSIRVSKNHICHFASFQFWWNW